MNKRYTLSIDRTLKKLNNDQKLELLSGKNYSKTQNIEELKIDSIRLCEGTNGLRKPLDDFGVENSEKSTCFPCQSTMASTWNPDLIEEAAEAIAQECKNKKVNVLFAPNLSIKRNPLAGRNFTFFSEDPYLNSKMGISYVNGLQKNHVGACIKDYILSNVENDRFIANNIIRRCIRNC